MLKTTHEAREDLMIAQLDADLLSCKTRFIVDIGSQICLVDPSVIAKHSKIVSIQKPFLAKGLNGKILIEKKVTLKFFNFFSHDFFILPNSVEILGEPALIGINFLDRIEAKIDLVKNNIQCVVNGQKGIISCEKRFKSNSTPKIFLEYHFADISNTNTTDADFNIDDEIITALYEEEKVTGFAYPDELHQSKVVLKVSMSHSDRIAILKQKLNWVSLEQAQKTLINDILLKYDTVFYVDGDSIKLAKEFELKLEFSDPNQKPIRHRSYRLAHALRDELNRQVHKMLKDGLIEISQGSEYSSPCLLVPKLSSPPEARQFRLVIDYRSINKSLKRKIFNAERMDDLLDGLGKSSIFSSVDVINAFYHIPLHPDSRDITSFTVGNKTYRFTCMPQGLAVSPDHFNRVFSKILDGIIGKNVFLYFDDCIIHATNRAEHDAALFKVLERFKQHGVKLRPEKCEILQKEIQFLGHTISEGTISASPRLVKAVKEFPRPKNKTEIQRFLGMCNFYRKFIKNYSIISEPLTRLTGKLPFEWSPAQEEAFETLKTALTTAPILIRADPDLPYFIECDSSAQGVGAILSQERVNPVTGKKALLPIMYWSKAFKESQRIRNAGSTAKELFGLVLAAKNFRHFILHKPVTVLIDNKALTQLNNLNTENSLLQAYRLKLIDYDLKIKYRKGELSQNVDSLSRVFLIKQLEAVNINHFNGADEILKNEFKFLHKHENNSDYDLKVVHNVTIDEKDTRMDLLKEAHDAPIGGHQNWRKTLEKIRAKGFTWKNMSKEVQDYCKSCDLCAKNNLSRKTKMLMEKTDSNDRPMQKLVLDIKGPLPLSLCQKEYLVTIIDSYSRFLFLIPVEKITAVEVADAILNNVILQFGGMESLLSDQGSNFMSTMFTRFCDVMGIKQYKSAAYSPTTNALIERTNRNLNAYMRKYIDVTQRDWPKYVKTLQFSYNTSLHDSTLYTPFFLFFARVPRIPSAFNETEVVASKYLENDDDYIDNVTRNIKRISELAVANSDKSKEKNKQYYDANANPVIFRVGERVLLKGAQHSRGRARKLEFQYSGPWTILEKEGNVNFKIKMNRTTKVVHANLLKKYYDLRNQDA